MTLHWWMHWFWVTANFVLILGVSLPPATVSTRKVMFVPRTTNGPENLSGTEKPLRSSPRNSKAISLFEPSNEVNILSQAGPDSSPTSFSPEKHFLETNRWQPPVTIPLAMFLPGFEIRDRQILNLVDSQNNLRIPKEAQNVFRTKGEILQTRRDTRITWILATNRHKRQKTSKEKLEEKWRNLTDYEEDLKVRPITVEEDRLEAVVNTSNRTLNRSEIFEVDEKVSEERSISQTASPMLQANIQEVSRERLNRARFSTVIQNSRAADRFSQKSFHEIDDQSSQSEFIGGILSQNSTVTALDIAAITGSCVVMVILISTVTSIGFILYRRKYLNPPQTLNSDKCSNPDSFGYIDDITIRDNSEEMYSLDNDSFLDSLEAMTIQNYWTDSVKHTKL